MTFPLSPAAYLAVLSLYKSTKDKRTANYLNLVLLKHKGYSQVAIADILNLDENTISTWLKKFSQSATIESYLTLAYSPYLGKLNSFELAKVNAAVCTHAYPTTQAIISQVATTLGVRYTSSGITNLLHRLGFSYKQKVMLPAKLDTAKQAIFVRTYDEVVAKLSEKDELFFMDDVHPQHNTHPDKAWLPKGKPSYLLSNTGRNRLNINGLYNPFTQKTIVTYHETINAQATIETFEKLKTAYPLKENLYVFADNAKYYVSKVLKAYLVENPQIKLIHLPPYSPNLNLIERLWKYLRKTVTNQKYYEKFETFTNQIKDFFENIEKSKTEIAKFIGTKFRLFETA